MWLLCRTLSNALFAIHTQTHDSTLLSKQMMSCVHKNRVRKASTEVCEKLPLHQQFRHCIINTSHNFQPVCRVNCMEYYQHIKIFLLDFPAENNENLAMLVCFYCIDTLTARGGPEIGHIPNVLYVY